MGDLEHWGLGSNSSAQESERFVDAGMEMLSMFGWPEYPPKLAPEFSRWWDQETVLLPDPEKLSGRIAQVVEWSGLPQVGKSSLEESLMSRLHQGARDLGFEIRVLPEEIVSMPTGLVHGLYDNFLEDDEIHPLYEKDWITSLHMQISKMHLWQKILAQETIPSPAEPGHYENPFVIGYRGVIDALCWTFALLMHTADENFTIPKWFHKAAVSRMRPVVSGLSIASGSLSAVILSGVSQETARERRKQAGKRSRGWVTDSPMFNDASSWYGHVVQHVIPRMRRLTGLGVLVLNGEKTQQENLDIVTDYLTRSMKAIRKG